MAEEKKLTFGEILINKGIISQKQLDTALAIQRDRYKKLHEGFNATLVREGIVSKLEMNRVFEEVGNQQGDIGTILLKKGLITEKQYQDTVEKQKKENIGFGDSVVALGFLSEDFFYNFLKKNVNLEKINKLLLERNIITQDDFNKISRRQKVGHRLGEILLYLEYIDEKNLYLIFAEQSGLPIRSLTGFVFKEDDLRVLKRIVGKQYAQDYCLVPLTVAPPNLVIAIADPYFINEINRVKRFYVEDYQVEYWLAYKGEIEKLQEILYSSQTDEEKDKNKSEIVSTVDIYNHRFKDDSELLPSDQESFTTFLSLGKSYMEMGMFEDALSEFQKSAQSPKLFVESNLYIVACYEKRGDLDGAIKICEEALQRPYITQRSSMELRYELGQIYFKKGEKRKALDIFSSINKMDPKYKEVAEWIRKLNN